MIENSISKKDVSKEGLAEGISFGMNSGKGEREKSDEIVDLGKQFLLDLILYSLSIDYI